MEVRHTRWPRFSLKTAFVVLTVLSVLFGLEAKKARDRHEAVVAIECLHGNVTYDWQVFKGGNGGNSRPNWLRQQLGDNLFSEVVSVDFSAGSGIDQTLFNSGLSNLKKFPYLKHLGLGGSKIADSSLLYLYELHALETVNLAFTATSEAAVDELRKELPQCHITHAYSEVPLSP